MDGINLQYASSQNNLCSLRLYNIIHPIDVHINIRLNFIVHFTLARYHYRN